MKNFCFILLWLKGRIFLYNFFILIFECKNLKIFIFSIWTCSTFSYLFFELSYLLRNLLHSVENKSQIALKFRNARKRHVNHFSYSFVLQFILHSNPVPENKRIKWFPNIQYTGWVAWLFSFLYFTQWLLQKISILINWQVTNFYNFTILSQII